MEGLPSPNIFKIIRSYTEVQNKGLFLLPRRAWRQASIQTKKEGGKDFWVHLRTICIPQAILSTAHNDFTAFTNCCILAFHNDTVNHFNLTVLQKLPGNIQTFHAIDTSGVNEEDLQHPAEYL